MSIKFKRISFAVTSDIEDVIDEAKLMFYDCTRSEMIRTLIAAGLAALKEEKAAKEKKGEGTF